MSKNPGQAIRAYLSLALFLLVSGQVLPHPAFVDLFVLFASFTILFTAAASLVYGLLRGLLLPLGALALLAIIGPAQASWCAPVALAAFVLAVAVLAARSALRWLRGLFTRPVPPGRRGARELVSVVVPQQSEPIDAHAILEQLAARK